MLSNSLLNWSYGGGEKLAKEKVNSISVADIVVGLRLRPSTPKERTRRRDYCSGTSSHLNE
jgi:hypothetical protein